MGSAQLDVVEDHDERSSARERFEQFAQTPEPLLGRRAGADQADQLSDPAGDELGGLLSAQRRGDPLSATLRASPRR